ncbi:MAG: hypothetical protein WHS44_02785 [Fimbriimonadales bacterium]|nr:MAG: hypothetical protein KatS3mg018_1979 [Fimbriimonadales bacterium]
MSELMVLLQALLLIAGWLLFLRAQTELRAQAARQSLTGELEALRQTIDALLQKLAEDAARAEARIEARLRELEQVAAPAREPAPLAHDTHTPSTPSAPAETLTPDSGYNLSGSPTSSHGAVMLLAQQGLSVVEIARQTGYAPGEVELILNLKRHRTEENE